MKVREKVRKKGACQKTREEEERKKKKLTKRER